MPIDGLEVKGFDHMHLVLVPDIISNSTYEQDEWLAIEGSFSGPANAAVLSTLGESGTDTLSDLNFGFTGVALQNAIGTPGSRGSRVLPVIGDPQVQWNFIAALARDINGQELPYHAQLIASRYLFNINSSSVIATLLYSIGIEIAQNLPFGVGRTNGWQTLLGTSGDDVLRIESTFINLVGGPGNDTFYGSDGSEGHERFAGGVGDDEFFWSNGSHTYHGGQLRLDYGADGIDTVNYTDVGEISIEINPARVPHKSADFIATHETGVDYLMSIETIKWGTGSDTVNLGEGLSLINERIVLDLGDQAALDQGDIVDFAAATGPVQLLAATNPDFILARDAANTESEAGIWLTSADWIVGTDFNDQAYLSWGIRGFEGGEGDDLIDAREVSAFDPRSPNGYDIEINGGNGSDTIVAGHGRTFINGGEGNDTIVISELSIFANGINEIIINDADSNDRLFASYNFFNETYAPFEGASLFPVLGAISQFSGEHAFTDLPQNQGPYSQGNQTIGAFSFFWQTNNDRFFADDETQGVFDFAGAITYDRDGSDLLIHIFSGIGDEFEDIGSNGNPYLYTENLTDLDSETIVRVVNFQEGDLGINFYDIGDATDFDYSVSHGDYTGSVFPNWDANVNILTNNGVLTAPLDPRPEAPTFDPNDDAAPPPPDVVIGSANDDVIVIASSSNQNVSGLDGDDTITTGAGDDIIDGGQGADTMDGGTGNDQYVVDNALDSVSEALDAGTDTILSSVSYVLPSNVENLTLTSNAMTPTAQSTLARTPLNPTDLDGTGNELRNTLLGNEAANQLTGLAGDDVLLGDIGNDVLVGGAGSDSYVYFAGDGDDQILDLGSSGDHDQLFLEGLSADEVSFYQLLNTPEDLIIFFDQGGRIEVIDYFDDSGNNTGVDRVIVSETDVWTRADIDAIVSLVGPVTNEAPQAADEESFALLGPNTTLSASVLLANDRDVDGDPLSITAVSSSSPDIVAGLDGNGDIVLATSVASEVFAVLTYTVSDGQGGHATAETGVVLYPNQAPNVGTISAQSSPEDTAWSYTLPDEIYNDPDGDTVVVSARLATGDALPAWLTFEPNTETFTGTPPENFNGILGLQVVVSDGEFENTIDFDLTITPINDAPVAQSDTGFETNEDESITISAGDLLANDSDIDGDSLSIESVSNAQNGSVTLTAAGNVEFNPTPGFSGTASFDYTVTDGAGGSATANTSLTVVADPDPPTTATIVGTPNNDRLIGTSDVDIFDGLAGNDRMIGRDGDDIFLGGEGRDLMRGGRGNDTADYSLSPEAVSITFFGVGFGRGGDAESDLLFSIETVLGSAHDDTITALWGDRTIDAQEGDDVVRGGFGNDELAGGTGSDQLSGGYGSDTFIFGDGDGSDTITDFSVESSGWWSHWNPADSIALDITSVTKFEDVLDHASEADGNVILDFGNNDVLTLQDLRLAQIDESHFSFA